MRCGRGTVARVIRSEAGNEGKVVRVVRRGDKPGTWLVKGDALRHVRVGDGVVRVCDWGEFPDSWLEPIPQAA